jgi:hypothetical protein
MKLLLLVVVCLVSGCKCACRQQEPVIVHTDPPPTIKPSF